VKKKKTMPNLDHPTSGKTTNSNPIRGMIRQKCTPIRAPQPTPNTEGQVLTTRKPLII